ncbi:zeta toxin family protein [Chamaesiphon sp. VAR_69_metabat_338]|uniref:zeta toxin family protein n=1 Tax=Chamaesiphon sp. VAR_69_metabat_338 TaxID=2964704 RepID=UPI00286DC1B9|nr:zeta toxin family protein [Chamaesiphon sp. VAR_69_metabat_338]
MPTLTIIAGANGSGKSTLTRQLVSVAQDENRSILLIDPDAIAKEIAPIDPASAAIAAGRKALYLSQQYVQSEASFVVETTFSGNTYIKLMCAAKSLGWLIVLMYIGIDNPSMNVLRVADRVKLGGHDVPREDILRRYERSLVNLNKAAKIVDRLIIYDNSTSAGHQLLATIEGDRAVVYVPELPNWVAKANLNL